MTMMASMFREPPKRAQRQDLAADTLLHTPDIFMNTEASQSSIVYPDLLPRVDPPNPSAGKPKVTVRNQDSFTAAKEILDREPSASVGVLNMASNTEPGGGWLKGSLAQEEALCLRSTLAATLQDRFYPLADFAAIWSSKVAVFRDEVKNWCLVYEPSRIFVVGVVSVAGLRCPPLAEDNEHFEYPGDIRVVKDKMRQVLRVFAKNNITHGVLGAMGCGAYRNPPREVARIYNEVMNEPEWSGVFEELVFAILDSRADGNYSIFKDALQNDA
ncbi:uncharacterized protein N7503_001967 [Penicillium pulvis]|uniref:uncharacterized protein n=1 Tax=Penicillium pulvis TaxID=1562058 RepID=UPI0025488B6B|nr:uncharacterized protein N7503_001967 [Penicillium pulvis]KAJ5809749.1 hypothetical protein N7503_001967 [Penicillium pulvis]